jgi:hypothetical protein
MTGSLPIGALPESTADSIEPSPLLINWFYLARRVPWKRLTAVLHHALDDYPDQRRAMHRITVDGAGVA